MTTFERIKQLSAKQGKSLQKVSEELGFGVNYLYQLKNQQPTAEKLTLIADYFDVSVDYLLGRDYTVKEYLNITKRIIDKSEKGLELTEEEKNFLEESRKLAFGHAVNFSEFLDEALSNNIKRFTDKQKEQIIILSRIGLDDTIIDTAEIMAKADEPFRQEILTYSKYKLFEYEKLQEQNNQDDVS